MSESTPIDPNSQPNEAIESTNLEVTIAEDRNAKTRQLLGMKGASAGETSIWKIRLQLMKPITWIPLIWGVVCGAASSGNYTWTLENVLKSALCMLLSGPLLTGYTQTINDYYDRESAFLFSAYTAVCKKLKEFKVKFNQFV
jgi:chlorophyll synthase